MKGCIGMAKMSFMYLMGLLEECHRFENMKFKKISESLLVGNRVVVDEYIRVLYRALVDFGMNKQKEPNALGQEIGEAMSLLLKYRNSTGMQWILDDH